jgi:hypothetical protein
MILHEWTDESAETVQQRGSDRLLEDVINLWNRFTLDEHGNRYTKYVNRTPLEIAEQIWDEVEGTVEYEKEDGEEVANAAPLPACVNCLMFTCDQHN